MGCVGPSMKSAMRAPHNLCSSVALRSSVGSRLLVVTVRLDLSVMYSITILRRFPPRVLFLKCFAISSGVGGDGGSSVSLVSDMASLLVVRSKNKVCACFFSVVAYRKNVHVTKTQ